MARLVWVGVGLVAGIAIGTAIVVSHGQEDGDDSTRPSPTTLAVAEKAGVDPVALLGAMDSTGLEPEQYLIAVGELALDEPPAPLRPQPPTGAAATPAVAPTPPQGWPIGGALGARIWCVEGIESSHGRFMYNPTPWVGGEHAQGWLGFLPSTARRWGAVIGNRASEWQAAARMIAAGQGGQFAGIAWGRC